MDAKEIEKPAAPDCPPKYIIIDGIALGRVSGANGEHGYFTYQSIETKVIHQVWHELVKRSAASEEEIALWMLKR